MVDQLKVTQMEVNVNKLASETIEILQDTVNNTKFDVILKQFLAPKDDNQCTKAAIVIVMLLEPPSTKAHSFAQKLIIHAPTLMRYVEIKPGHNQLLRSTCLKLWNSLSQRLRITDLEMIFHTLSHRCIDVEWTQLEAFVSVCGLILDTNTNTIKLIQAKLLEILQQATNPILISTCLLSLSNIAIDVYAQSYEVFLVVFKYVTHENLLVRTAAMQAMPYITNTIVYIIQHLPLNTALDVTLDSIADMILQKTREIIPLLDQDYQDSFVQFTSYYDQFPVVNIDQGKIIRSNDCLYHISTALWLEQITIYKDDELKKVWKRLADTFLELFYAKTNFLHSYTHVIISGINSLLHYIKDEMAPYIEQLIDYCLDRIEAFLDTDVISADITEYYSTAAIVHFISLPCFAVRFTALENTKNIMFTTRKERIVRLLDRCFYADEKHNAVKDFLYHFYSGVIEKDIAGLLHDSEQEAMDYLLNKVVPMAINHIISCAAHTGAPNNLRFDESLMYYLVNDSLCFVIIFAKYLVMNNQELTVKCRTLLIDELFSHVRTAFHVVAQDPNRIDPLSLSNYSHLTAVLYSIYGDVISQSIFPFIGITLLDVLNFKLLSVEDNIDIITAFTYMLEDNILMDKKNDTSAVTNLFNHRANSLMSSFINQANVIKRGLLLCRILESLPIN
jgi:hypothetical protein